MKKVAIFGSTGSIGESTLNVVRENKDLFDIVTLVAGKNINKLKVNTENKRKQAMENEISYLEDKIDSLEIQIESLEEEIYEKDIIIDDLRNEY